MVWLSELVDSSASKDLLAYHDLQDYFTIF
jgi:hypothetical protein